MQMDRDVELSWGLDGWFFRGNHDLSLTWTWIKPTFTYANSINYLVLLLLVLIIQSSLDQLSILDTPSNPNVHSNQHSLNESIRI